MTRYIVFAILACFALPPQTNSAGIFESTPDKLICSFLQRPGRPAGRIVFYIDTKFADGTAWYRSLGEVSRVVVLEPDGSFASSTTLFQLKDCEKL